MNVLVLVNGVNVMLDPEKPDVYKILIDFCSLHSILMMSMPLGKVRHYGYAWLQCIQSNAKFVNVYVHEHEHKNSRAKADRLKGEGFNLEGD